MPSGRIPSLSFEYVILTLLLSGPRHGYELFKDMEAWQGLGEVWKIKQSMLYADLNKLEKLGHVASMPPDLQYSPPRVNFIITDKGRSALEAWVSSPVQKPREIRPEFLTKLLVAERFGRVYTQKLLEMQKAKAQEWLDAEDSQETVVSGLAPEFSMVLSFRAHWLKSVAEWLDSCLVLLDRSK